MATETTNQITIVSQIKTYYNMKLFLLEKKLDFITLFISENLRLLFVIGCIVFFKLGVERVAYVFFKTSIISLTPRATNLHMIVDIYLKRKKIRIFS